ncbi:MAG: hypothetical protein M3329_00505 [Pseudomonadota bacterium]|nr:hypothetical protein [Pseudomonadota bacterium]
MPSRLANHRAWPRGLSGQPQGAGRIVSHSLVAVEMFQGLQEIASAVREPGHLVQGGA